MNQFIITACLCVLGLTISSHPCHGGVFPSLIALFKSNKARDEKIETLTNEIAGLKDEVKQLKEANEEAKETDNKLKEAAKKQLEAIEQSLRVDIDAVKVENSEQNSQLSGLKEAKQKLQACTSPRSFFLARGDVDWAEGRTHVTLKYNEKLVLSKALVNVGDGYNPSTGEFKCKEPGLYQFTLTAKTQHGKDTCIRVQLNGQRKFTLATHHDETGSGVTINPLMTLRAGDVIRLVGCSKQDVNVNLFETSFSGHLIQSDKCL